MNNWDKMVSGRLYNAASKEVDDLHRKGLINCEKFNRISIKRPNSKRRMLEKLIPSSKDSGITIFSPFYCEYGKNIIVGKNCFINYNCTFLDVSLIRLEDNVFIGADVCLATPNHPLVAKERILSKYPDGEYVLEYSKPITIKENVWICSKALICGGVTIGENSVVAAGSVVTKDVPPNCLVGGVPAKVIREITDDDLLNVYECYINEDIPMSIKERSR